MKEMTLEEVKRCSLETLLFFDRYCKEKGITWWLAGGTLLGAVRHKGFIPWDDDIDIMMSRRDFNRLCTEFPNTGRYRFLTIHNTENFPFLYGKFVDSSTLKDEMIRKRYTRIGIDVDVFPIDNLPCDKGECEKYYGQIAKLGRQIDGLVLNYGRGKTVFSTILKNGFIFFQRGLEALRIISFKRLQLQFSSLAQKYNNEDCEYWGVTCINHYGIKERNHKSGYHNSVLVEFEGYHFPAPEGFDTYLAQLYGSNYMQLPPEDERASTHTFRAYKL